MGIHAASLLLFALAASPQQPEDTAQVHYLGVPSDLLAEFHGSETLVEAGVVLPTDYRRGERIPIVYHVHGFGGSHRSAWRAGPPLIEQMNSGEAPRMLHVYLNARCALGHHAFADSANTGPWASALVEEFIPALEQKYGVVGGPQSRFLTGHSSGGWSTLWLQVDRPDDFNGTWSTAPDSSDFRDFTGIDIYSYENAFVDPDGEVIQLMRRGEEWVRSIREFVDQEMTRSSYGGQFASFDAVFSPRGEDGRPKELFDRTTGEIDRGVAKSWERYDIRLLLERRWEYLAPRVDGKLNVYCGTADTFRLEGPAMLLRDSLAALGSNAQFYFPEGRSHGSIFAPHEQMWPDGLMAHIYAQMQQRFEQTSGPVAVQTPAHNKSIRPNIVLILADDLGWGDVGAMNPASKIPTPHLDLLAAEGMRFNDAHSPSAVCTPTRYGLLTGRNSWRTRMKSGVLWGEDRLLIEPERATLGTLLQQQGYATGVIGKWHLGLGAWNGETESTPTDFANIDAGPHTVGFEHSSVIPASLDIPPYLFIRDGIAEAAPDATVAGSKRWWAGGAGFWREGPASPDFDHHDVLPRIGREAVTWITERSVDENGRPFFLYLPLTSPHTPWLPSEEWTGVSQAGPYGDFVAQTDAVVGQVLAALEARRLTEDTLIIVTSDNGSHWRQIDVAQFNHAANGPWRGMKADIEEGGHRVPMLVRWPGRVPAGQQSDALVGLVDWYATLAELFDSPLATGEAEDSHSMLRVLFGLRSGARADLVHHSISGSFALRQGRWKLIDGLGSGGFTAPRKLTPSEGQLPYRLYDLHADPGETDDLAQVRPEVVERLRRRLEALRAE